MTVPFDKLFSDGKTVELLSIGRVAEWFTSKGQGRLRLPPIQRSFVWQNAQIVNYWDSLMRGYPAGMMMVTRTAGARHYGRDSDNRTEELSDTDFQLFDGQQRLATLLLGLGKNSLADSLRLWVDIGKPEGSGDRLYELRINSTGQPFGYSADDPNTKLSAADRLAAHQDWPIQDDGMPRPPDAIFREMSEELIGRLSSAKCAVSLSYILTELMAEGMAAAAKKLKFLASQNAANAEDNKINDLLTRLDRTLKAEIIVKLVDGTVLDESNYTRFFERLGQGGTRLSNDELSYSLIKDRYPKVHDRVEDIVKGPGRFASEVDLVLGASRVAQTLAPWPDSKEWEQVCRLTPDGVRKVHEKGKDTTEPYFLSMLPDDDNAPVRLETAARNLRVGLLYDATSNSCGLPSMLLAHLPGNLLDVLLLFAFKRGESTPWEGEDRRTLIAFVLHWLIFVKNEDRASYHTFKEVHAAAWRFGKQRVAALIRYFENEGFARIAPRDIDWPCLKKEVEQRGYRLAAWNERFSGSHDDDRPSPGEALRQLSTNNTLIRRALIWLQRRYITLTFPHYDPTLTRDDDLPFDLDHAIPQGLFGAHWAALRGRIVLPDPNQFNKLRHTVGNSLGNLRWLAAADNRRRGMRPIEAERPQDGEKPSIDDYLDRPSWNTLIDTTPWAEKDVATFQRLIDSRTILLTQILMNESGIKDLIDTADDLT